MSSNIAVKSTDFKILNIDQGDNEYYDTYLRDTLGSNLVDVTFLYKNDPEKGVLVWDGKDDGVLEECPKSLADFITQNTDRIDDFVSIIIKATKDYQLRTSLTPKTQQTFNDLINEL